MKYYTCYRLSVHCSVSCMMNLCKIALWNEYEKKIVHDWNFEWFIRDRGRYFLDASFFHLDQKAKFFVVSILTHEMRTTEFDSWTAKRKNWSFHKIFWNCLICLRKQFKHIPNADELNDLVIVLCTRRIEVNSTPRKKKQFSNRISDLWSNFMVDINRLCSIALTRSMDFRLPKWIHWILE